MSSLDAAGARPPLVSIVVPLEGAPIRALACLEGIAAQGDAVPFEVIVVDNASVGLDHLLACLAGDLTIVPTPRRLNLAGALSRGLASARGELVVLIRGAAAPQPGWLDGLLAAVRDGSTTLAASVTLGQTHSTVVDSWSVCVPATFLQSAPIPPVDDALVFPALALAAGGHAARLVPASRIARPSTHSAGGRRRPGEAPEVTIVIPTLDAASERVRGCIAAIQSATDVPHELVIVDNGSPPQGFSSPVNAGLRAAHTPYVVVMNDDVEPLAGWWSPLREAIDAGAAVAFPMTVEGAMRHDFAAWCFAVGREGVRSFSHAPGEFFDPRLVIWYQDTDLLHRLRKAGRPPLLVPESRIRHGLSQTLQTEDPQLRAWLDDQVVRDRERFLAKHPDAVMNGHALAA